VKGGRGDTEGSDGRIPKKWKEGSEGRILKEVTEGSEGRILKEERKEWPVANG
jgi:hypothetical protein